MEIIACGLAATTTAIDVGASLNIATTKFIAVRVVGFAIPMGTGVILSTPTGRKTITASTTTRTTATDNKLENPLNSNRH